MTDRLAIFSKKLLSVADAAIITSDVNRRYFLGFSSSAGTILVLGDKSYFIIDSRYYEAAKEAVQGCEIILQGKLYEQLGELLKKHGVKTLGVESEKMTLSKFVLLKSKLTGVEILQDERVSRLISRQRGIKSAAEIASIAAAQDIADKTFLHILNFIKHGKSELEIVVEMEQYSRREGSEQPAFSYIVAAGVNSSRPHAMPCENKVKAGDFIVLDYGATVNGYRSDMTRTVAVGFAGDKQREVYATVLKAQLAALDAVKAGVCCFDVDKAGRDIIDSTDYKGLFGHGLGHSLGLEIHEDPRFSTECIDTLESGAVMSVEPGIYIPGEFGVRIEDIVVATEHGCRNLVKSDKSLIIL